MARRSEHFGVPTRMHGRSRLVPVIAAAGVLGLVGALVGPLLLTPDAGQANGHSAASAMHSVDEPDDNRLQAHAHHAEPLSEQAYKDAPSDVVLWGDLARALVVRKGSTYQTTFLPPVLALDGKTVSIVGYVTPVAEGDRRSRQFLLSSHAFLCDACEPPAPTELVEVNTEDLVLATAGVATIRGQFEVVRDDPKGLAYRLNKAIILKQQQAH